MPDHRLPIYLLVNCSAAVRGAPLEAMQQTLRGVVAELQGNPHALETVSVSVIRFGREACQVVPLTDLNGFALPDLTADPPGDDDANNLGRALALLQSRLDAEVRRAVPDVRGDYRPLLFLLTDGTPTDAWEDIAEQVRLRCGGVAVLLARSGDAANPYRSLGPDTTGVVDADRHTIGVLTRWATQSITADER